MSKTALDDFTQGKITMIPDYKEFFTKNYHKISKRREFKTINCMFRTTNLPGVYLDPRRSSSTSNLHKVCRKWEL